MANINLLPWREEQRRQRNQMTLAMCVAIWVFAAVLVFFAKTVMDGRIEGQQSRNQFLQTEINKLQVIIKEIDSLKEKRDALLARMDVIQNLQQNRSQIVHVFDDLVNKLPVGVYYDTIKKSDDGFSIAGRAQSNGRVSALMRSLDASDWFDGATLKVVDVVDENGALISKFDMSIKEERKDQNQEINDF